MNSIEKSEQNQDAYRRLKETINTTYPPGRFIAIDESRIVGDAATFAELTTLLRSQGRNPTETLIVQSGMDYPEHLIILLGGNGE